MSSRNRVSLSRQFNLYWAGQALSETGVAFASILLPLIAVTVLNATAFQVSALQSATTFAFIIAALPVGAYVDRRSKRTLMVSADLMRATLFALLYVLAATGKLGFTLLMLVVAVVGVASVFFDSANQALLPSIVGQAGLLKANGRLAATQSLAGIVGPAAAALLTLQKDYISSALFVSATYTISGISVLCLASENERTAGADEVKTPILRDMRAGVNFLLRNPVLKRQTVAAMTMNFSSQIIFGLEVVYLVRELHISPDRVAIPFALATASGVVCGLIVDRAYSVFGNRLIWLAPIVLNLLLLLIPLAHSKSSVGLYVVGISAYSASSAVFFSGYVTNRQVLTPPGMLSRVGSAARWLTWGVMPLGALTGGLLAELIGVRSALVVAALLTWSGSLWLLPYRTCLRVGR